MNKYNYVVSSFDEKNNSNIDKLENELANYYRLNSSYYENIDFTKEYWFSNVIYRDLLEIAKQCFDIAEIGCGKSNILEVDPALQTKYTGLDFSSDMLAQNKERFPDANFIQLTSSNHLPLEKKFDLVFSVFVLEHVVRPHLFLENCNQILKPGGTLVIICPNYVGFRQMTSIKVGLSFGSVSSKIKRLKFLDALISFFESKVLLPKFIKNLGKMNVITPNFFVNTQPLVFGEGFVFPDADAVYFTDENEIDDYMKSINYIKLNSENDVATDCIRRKWLYLKYSKIQLP